MTTEIAAWGLRCVWDAELQGLLQSCCLADLQRAATVAMAFPRLLKPDERHVLGRRGTCVMEATMALKNGVNPFCRSAIEDALEQGADVHAAFLNNGVPFLCTLTEHTPRRKAADLWYDGVKADLAKTMIFEGADVNAVDPRNGRTPLHNAASWGAVQLVRYLIAAGADTRAKDHAGRSPYDVVPRRCRRQLYTAFHDV